MGTAKNIAMACNILPASADVLELTTETFDVLESVSTLKMASIQRKIDQERARLAPGRRDARAESSATSAGSAADDGEEHGAVVGANFRAGCRWWTAVLLRPLADGMHGLAGWAARLCRFNRQEVELEEQVRSPLISCALPRIAHDLPRSPTDPPSSPTELEEQVAKIVAQKTAELDRVHPGLVQVRAR